MLNAIVDTFYCINLKHRQDRWNNVSKEFQKIGITDRIHRIEGVNYNSSNFLINRMACSASHLLAINTAIENNNEYFVVFEDDIFFLDNSVNIINSAIDDLFKFKIDWNILFFGCRPNKDRQPAFSKTQSDNLIKVNCAQAAHAILYNKKTAIEIQNKLNIYPFELSNMIDFGNKYGVYDSFLKEELVYKKNCYCTSKLACNQITDYSNIDCSLSNRTIEIGNDFDKEIERL